MKVVTDHQPLIGICNGKNLDAVNNVRIQRMLSKTLGYEFRVLYMEGKLNLIADALSRLPVFAAEKDDPDLVCTVGAAKLDESGQMSNCTSDLALHEIMEVAEANNDYQLNYKALDQHKQLKSFPRDHPAQKLSSIWDALSVEDELPNLMLYHGRIYVPQGA